MKVKEALAVLASVPETHFIFASLMGDSLLRTLDKDMKTLVVEKNKLFEPEFIKQLTAVPELPNVEEEYYKLEETDQEDIFQLLVSLLQNNLPNCVAVEMADGVTVNLSWR